MKTKISSTIGPSFGWPRRLVLSPVNLPPWPIGPPTSLALPGAVPCRPSCSSWQQRLAYCTHGEKIGFHRCPQGRVILPCTTHEGLLLAQSHLQQLLPSPESSSGSPIRQLGQPLVHELILLCLPDGGATEAVRAGKTPDSGRDLARGGGVSGEREEYAGR